MMFVVFCVGSGHSEEFVFHEHFTVVALCTLM